MTQSTARQRVLGGVARLCLLVGLMIVGIFSFGEGVGEVEALAIMPWLCCALLCYLAPLFVSPNTDLFSPPGFIGLRNGFNIAAIMAAVASAGGASFPALGYLTVDQRISLAQNVALLHIVAHLAYLAGYYGTSGRLFSRLLPSVSHRRWEGRRVLLALILTSIVGGTFYAIFQALHGGAIFDISNMGRGKAVLRADDSLSWLVRGMTLAFIPVLLLVCVALQDKSRRLLIVAGLAYLVVSLLLMRSGMRGTSAIVGLMLLVLFHFFWCRIRITVAVVLLLGTVVTANILGEYRAGGEATTEFSDGMSKPVASMATHEEDRHRMDVLGVVLYYFPERQDYLMGRTYAPLPLLVVPTWLWPEKKQYFGWSDTSIVRRLVGLPAPVPYQGVLYANFSWLGVVLGMALFGAFHRGLYRYREQASGHVGTALVYVSMLGFFSPTLLGITMAAQFVIPVTLLCYAVSRRSTPSKNTAAVARGRHRFGHGALDAPLTRRESS